MHACRSTLEDPTGCVKITPAHDFNDNALGARHGLPLINVLNADATMADSVPERFRGLDRFACRKAVVAELEQLGLLGEVKPHKLMVPRGDRSNAVVEPFLTDQWYMRMAPLAAPALAAVKDGRIKFVPENWSKTYFQWLENIQDWCISRQLWWGHRIPAWYDEQGNIYVGKDEAAVRAKHGLSATLPLRQDPDVLDTWYSAALWPFGIMGWPQEGTAQADPRFAGYPQRFLPTDVLVTGFDIIFFWVARMVMMTMHFKKDAAGQPVVPFKEVYITGLIRDEHGQKMSKSKGNIIDPIDLIDGIGLEELVAKRTAGMMRPADAEKIAKRTRKQFPDGIKPSGTDALRFTLAALAGPSRDINFDPGRLEGYRNFCTKLWNASRFVLMNTEGQDCGASAGAQPLPRELSLADRWIQQRLAQAVAEFELQMAAYRFDLATKALYDFTWYEFCDWYLELSKPVLNDAGASEAAKRGTRHTLITTLEQLLRALHPLMPFITEEIWQRVAMVADVTHANETRSVMLQPFPTPSPAGPEAAAIEAEMAWVQAFVLGIRQIRAEMDIAPGKPLPVLVEGADAETAARVERQRGFLIALARLDKVELLKGEAPAAAAALLGGAKLLVPMKGLIDKDAELARLDKLLAKLEADVPRVEGKLANESYVKNAPAEVIAKDRERLAELANQIAEFKAQRAKVQAL